MGAVVKQLAGIVRAALLLVAQGVRTRTQSFASERQERALYSLSLSLSLARVTRDACRALHRLACSSTSSHPSPSHTRQTYEHLPPSLFFLLISHYTKHSHPAQSNPSSRKRTLPHALYHPSTIIVHIPACPCPDTPSCDSTTARLTTPTLPLQPITSICSLCQPPAVSTQRSTSLRRTSPPSFTSYQPSRLSNHPSTSQGPQQQQQQPAATPLYLTANDTHNTTYARFEIAESVENPVADAPSSSAASR